MTSQPTNSPRKKRRKTRLATVRDPIIAAVLAEHFRLPDEAAALKR